MKNLLGETLGEKYALSFTSELKKSKHPFKNAKLFWWCYIKINNYFGISSSSLFLFDQARSTESL